MRTCIGRENKVSLFLDLPNRRAPIVRLTFRSLARRRERKSSAHMMLDGPQNHSDGDGKEKNPKVLTGNQMPTRPVP